LVATFVAIFVVPVMVQAQTAKNQQTSVEPVDVILIQYVINGAVDFTACGKTYTFTVETLSVPFPGLTKYHVTVTAKNGNKQTFSMSVSELPDQRHIDILPLD
jgi:hypothetical protein